jgi:hypothetical protein
MRADRRFACGTALFVVGAAVLSACQTLLGPKPIDENWRAVDGPRVSFFVRPGSAAEQNAARLSEVAEDQYSSTVRSLGLSYAGHIRAYAYASAADARLVSDFSGLAYPETEAFRFVCAAPITGNTFSLMGHEQNHVMIIGGLGRAGTYFMTEGLASAVVSETFHANGRRFLFPWTRLHRADLPRVARLMDDSEWKRVDENVAYNTSASFLAWLLDTYGAEPLRAIYPASSDEIVGRVTSVYGRPLEALEADWLRFCDTYRGGA